MGIFEWVKSLTGIWGPVLLDIYFRNAGWLNTLLVAYGLLLLLSWQNLSRISDSLIGQIMEQAKSKKHKTIRIDDFDLSWDDAIASSRFPLVAKQTGIMVYRCNMENIRALISERDLIQRCLRRLRTMGFHLELEN